MPAMTIPSVRDCRAALAMTILFKGIPFCARPETAILEGAMRLSVTHNGTDWLEIAVQHS